MARPKENPPDGEHGARELAGEPRAADAADPGAQLLVVEDDLLLRETLGDLLSDEGFTVAVAAHGLEALHYLRTCPAPHVILMDLRMPVMDGWKLCGEMRREPALAAIPVLLVSSAPDLPEQSALLGADGYLEKPIDVSHLLHEVRRFAAPRRPRVS